MGERSRKWKAFAKNHPICAFCGGSKPAETIEHYPPKSMFRQKLWPEGFEFPACDDCNSGSRTDDLIMAIVARLDPLDGAAARDDGSLNGLMSRLRYLRPTLLDEMIPSAREARTLARQMQVSRVDGKTFLESRPFVRFTPTVQRAIQAFALKLTKAIVYREAKTIFPVDGSIFMTWSTNLDLLESGSYPIFDALQDLPGLVPEVKRHRDVLHDQFGYKWTADSDIERFVIQVKIAFSIAFVVIGCPKPGVLEKLYLLEAHEANGRTAVLQSQSLPLGRLRKLRQNQEIEK